MRSIQPARKKKKKTKDKAEKITRSQFHYKKNRCYCFKVAKLSCKSQTIIEPRMIT